MKSNLKNWCGVIAAVILIVGLMAGSVSQVYAQAVPRIVPVQAPAVGMTYSEWSAKWWQWAFSLPVDKNPFFDEGGNCSNGANGQDGPVWFLTGVINTTGIAERNCTVPAGKFLFFPIINSECSTIEPDPWHGENEQELRDCVMRFVPSDVSAEIDDKPVTDLYQYFVISPLFTFTLPENDVLSLGPGTAQSVSNGYWLMLAPLSAGQHKIHFRGTVTFCGDLENPSFSFTIDITYNLTVASRRP